MPAPVVYLDQNRWIGPGQVAQSRGLFLALAARVAISLFDGRNVKVLQSGDVLVHVKDNDAEGEIYPED